MSQLNFVYKMYFIVGWSINLLKTKNHEILAEYYLNFARFNRNSKLQHKYFVKRGRH
jgi:hypothetical protein